MGRYIKKPSGFGDTIHNFTTATGIKKIVQKVSGEKDCGCNKRQQQLNKKFPYKNV